MKKENTFYVYAYLDTRKLSKYAYGDYSFEYKPFYIGKGCEHRCNDHIYEAENIFNKGIKINKKNFPNINIHKIRIILKIYETTGKWPIVKIISDNISENEAFFIETKCIQTIGRHNFNEGPLTNLTDGGEGVSNPSEETRKQRSKIHKGKIVSIETRKKQRKAKLGIKQSKEIIEKELNLEKIIGILVKKVKTVQVLEKNTLMIQKI